MAATTIRLAAFTPGQFGIRDNLGMLPDEVGVRQVNDHNTDPPTSHRQMPSAAAK